MKSIFETIKMMAKFTVNSSPPVIFAVLGLLIYVPNYYWIGSDFLHIIGTACLIVAMVLTFIITVIVWVKRFKK